MKIEVVLWDFGGVFTGSPFEAIDHYARSQNADPEAFRRLVFGDYAVDGDHVWHRLERGEISMLDADPQRRPSSAVGWAQNLATISVVGGLTKIAPAKPAAVVAAPPTGTHVSRCCRCIICAPYSSTLRPPPRPPRAVAS